MQGKTIWRLVALLVVDAGLNLHLAAAENVMFRGTLIEPPPCSISDDERIDVDFGQRVGINKIDGANFKQLVNYRISCEAGINTWEMSLTLGGLPTTYDDAAVQTDKDGLGIRLLLDGKPFTLNEPVNVDPKAQPILEAVPVQRPGSTLTEGAFEATATLQADYQ